MAQVIDGQKVDIKIKSRNPIIEFDRLQMYMGYPYIIDLEDTPGQIQLTLPSIGQIAEIGEKKFYETLNIFITNTTSYRLLLWEHGMDWNETSDFDLFCMLFKQINPEVSSLLFKNVDFSLFKVVQKNNDDGTTEIVLYNKEKDLEINQMVYYHFSQYFRNAFNIFPEEKLTTDKLMKEMFIMKDKRKIANEQYMKEHGEEKSSSSLQSLISACVNHPGFKYKLSEIREVGICEFYDSVKRLQIYENTTALLKGMYSGFVSGKNIKADDYNFMKDI